MQDAPARTDQEFTNIEQQVSDRTLELAKLNGRAPHQISQADYEQAKREVRNRQQSGTL